MTDIFGQFDFRLLDDPEFCEDSVREELVVPLLAALGYSASGPNRIIRSRRLEHPYVYFGTVRKGINIIPDYLLERGGELAWVLDAKAPTENVDTGKNVEQAYSYAMHRDIRVPFYALCNGRKLVVNHVSHAEPVIDIALQDINKEWPVILGLLGCESAWPGGIPPGFLPDMGLALLKAGFDRSEDGKKYFHMFCPLRVDIVTKIQDDLYSVNGTYAPPESVPFIVTFDFGVEEYAKFLEALSPEMQQGVKAALSQQPYRAFFKEAAKPWLTIMGHLGDETFTNENESYRPFIAEAFITDVAPEGQ